MRTPKAKFKVGELVYLTKSAIEVARAVFKSCLEEKDISKKHFDKAMFWLANEGPVEILSVESVGGEPMYAWKCPGAWFPSLRPEQDFFKRS